ncbi:hsp90 co-chaperone Cdc37 [Athalia rosae]|uniref:hsp90 co-chaperone Cdc37 n=1 Tax=Athalia rosae TaxID=37344 RepID=UPI0020336209|nr:hsp90 co-chaperone Cdc37 [Athalia rosae]
MVDYSKWKNIEISDDEDDTHPNIDTPSLFRWRHQARIERMEEHKKEQARHQREKEEIARKLKEAKEKLAKAGEQDSEEVVAVRKSLEELEVKESEMRSKEEELKKKEKLQPWNVDTIARPGFTKTVINKKEPRKTDDSDLPDEEKENIFKQFVKTNEKLIKKFGMLQKYDDSKKFLQEHLHLVCENTAHYLVIWCIDLEMEEKSDLMEHVAHQCICMQYIIELSKQLDVDPRGCVGSFFSRIQVAEVEYKKSFDDELSSFKDRIRKRAAEKIAKAIRESEEEERKARLGPGGLDPDEVFQELPPALQTCFEKRDIPLLEQTMATMDPDQARYYMKRCIDSGLWVPDARSAKNQQEPADELTLAETETESEADTEVNESPDPK